MSYELRDIPVVILAGGRGARFDHESQVLPKPMISVAGQPIIEHIVDSFVAQSFREFIIATGYLGEKVVEHYESVGHRFSWDRSRGIMHCWLRRYGKVDPVFVKCWDTGEQSHTGMRLVQLSDVIRGRHFVLTYGDGLCDVDMRQLIETHRELQPYLSPMVTVTAVNPPGRFGVIEMEGGAGYPHCRLARSFAEKPVTDQWINGGFMFMEDAFIDRYVREGRELESEALAEAARCGDLCAYLHRGYWRCMDTRRDLEQIEADVTAGGGRLPWMRTEADGGKVSI